MVALFCILRGCTQEVYGKVHKTRRAFFRERNHRNGRWCSCVGNLPHSLQALSSLPAIKAEGLLQVFLPSLLCLTPFPRKTPKVRVALHKGILSPLICTVASPVFEGGGELLTQNFTVALFLCLNCWMG